LAGEDGPIDWLIRNGRATGEVVTASTAELLETFPAELLTATLNCAPLSETVSAAVV